MWVPDPDAVWVSAVILQDYSLGDKQLRLQLSDGKVTVENNNKKKKKNSTSQKLLTSIPTDRR